MKDKIKLVNPNAVSIIIPNRSLSYRGLFNIVYRHFRRLSAKHNVRVYETNMFGEYTIGIEGSSKRLKSIIDLRSGYLIGTLKKIKRSVVATGSLKCANEIQEIIDYLIEIKQEMESNNRKLKW